MVTVTYPGEYPMLLIQARSVVTYVRLADIEELVLIINADLNDARHSDLFSQILETYKVAGFPVRVVHRDELKAGQKIDPKDGWKDQQAFKLLIANSIKTDHYLLLDTKNFFTSFVTHQRLIPDGKAISFSMKCSPVMQPYLEASARAMGVDELDLGASCMPTATPYIMNRRVVLDLLQSIDEPFGDFFYREYKVTEFFIYYWYMKKLGIVESHYTFVPQFYATFFASYPSTPEQIQAIKKLAGSPQVFSVAVHRKRISSSSPDFLGYLYSLWMRHGLIKNQGEFSHLIELMSDQRQ